MKTQFIVVCAPRRPMLPMEIEQGWECKDVNCAQCGTELMFRPDPEIPEEAVHMCADCAAKKTSGARSEFRMTKRNRETIKKLGGDPDALLRTFQKQRESFLQRMFLAIIRRWWDLEIFFSKLRYTEDLVRLSAMNDGDFADVLEHFQKHPNSYIRTLASMRWCRVTWPKDHPNVHTEDARLVFGRGE